MSEFLGDTLQHISELILHKGWEGEKGGEEGSHNCRHGLLRTFRLITTLEAIVALTV